MKSAAAKWSSSARTFRKTSLFAVWSNVWYKLWQFCAGEKPVVKILPSSTELTDRIEKYVVSKVSEVATKKTKPTPDVPLLTEAQILAMSEKDYMNEAQLAFFRARLQQLERDLVKNAGETTEHLRETVLVPD